jgi:hypothetical protein
MTTEQSIEMRDLTPGEAQDTHGGVMEGGCISPAMQQLLDALNPTTWP